MSQMMQSEPYVSLATRRKLSDYSILVDGAALVSVSYTHLTLPTKASV